MVAIIHQILAQAGDVVGQRLQLLGHVHLFRARRFRAGRLGRHQGVKSGVDLLEMVGDLGDAHRTVEIVANDLPGFSHHVVKTGVADPDQRGEHQQRRQWHPDHSQGRLIAVGGETLLA